jgi:hypothetical protein
LKIPSLLSRRKRARSSMNVGRYAAALNIGVADHIKRNAAP